MCDPRRLLTIQETAELLHMNPEVIRRWLRSKKLSGTKVGSDWRVSEVNLRQFLHPQEGGAEQESGPKMCIKFPKWLEFSGLPKKLNSVVGPGSWGIFKKLIEFDFESGTPVDKPIKFDLAGLQERVGQTAKETLSILQGLAKAGYIQLIVRSAKPAAYIINRPIKTPKSILDIPFAEGGVKGAPEKAFESNCLRRYV